MELTKETSLFKKDAIKTDVTAAAATATNYIDDVPNSSQTGMTLQPASNTANNYIQLDSDGLAVYKAGQLIASYGQSILLYHPGVSPLNAAVEITNNSARFTGQIQADSGYIGGWSIGADTNQSLHNGAANVSPAPGEGKIILSTGISGSNVQNGLLPPNKTWAFTAGNQFGVTTDGELYANGAHLKGLSVGNYSDATTNHLYGNCVWTPSFAAYFNTDLGNTRRIYQGWTIEQNTGEYFDFDATNNWLVVDYSNYADKTTTKVLQQNTGIVAPNTNFTISADLGTDCKVVFGGVEISGTDWQTADDGRKYATITTTVSTTSGVFEIWPVASENYIFKGNKFKLEKSDSYSSWTTLDEQIGKTGNAISQSAEATASYFLNFTSADGLKISNNADPSTTTTDYIQITSNGVKTVYDSTHYTNLDSNGLKIYGGDADKPVANYGSTINLYKPGTNVAVATIDANGGHFTGEITADSGYIGGTSGWEITTNTIKKGNIGSGIVLSATNTTYSGAIGGSVSNISNWRFTVGNQFGITADGTLYANAGKIGGCSIESGILKIKDVNIDGKIAAGHLEIGDFSVTRTSSGVVVKIGSTSANVYDGADGARGADGIDVTSQYVTYIDGTNGVRVYSGSSTTAKRYYAQVNSDGLTVVKNNTIVASFGSTVQLGSTSSNYVTIDSSAMTFHGTSNLTFGTKSDGICYILPGAIGLEISNGNSTLYDLFCGDFQASSINSTSSINAWKDISCGTYFNSEYTYKHPGGANASTVQGHTVYVAANGNFIMGNSNSTKKVKHSIALLSNKSLNPHKLYDIPVVQFIYNTDYLGNEKDCRYLKLLPGFIAEDINDIYPVAADISEEGRIVGWNEHYIIPPMLALIQEQHKEIEQLKKDIQELKK